MFQPVPNLLLDDQGGQQVNIRTDGKTPTLRAEAHGNVPCVVESAGFKAGQGHKARSIGWAEEKAPTLASEAGGNSVPSVCVKTWDARGNGDGETVSTITGDHENRITDYSSVVVAEAPTYSLQGNTVDRDAKQNGSGICEGVAHTLNSVDRHAVCYADTYQKTTGPLMANSHPGSYSGQDAYTDMFVVGKVAAEEVHGVDRRNMTENPELYPTLQAKPNGGQSLNYSGAMRVQYIVRRLTPTECARLQGFADRWGDIDEKDAFTPEEFQFWLDVRNTHAAINGRAVKDYTEKQMLAWYSKLHTDSAEYKMWGNGIALPPALYCMQGMADALEAAGEDDWML